MYNVKEKKKKYKYFFFSSRRRHTRCLSDWEFRRVLFRSARLTMSDFRFHGITLDFQDVKTGISRMTPPLLTKQLHSLPAILHITYQRSISEYSKGSRGLSVPLWVNGIFTATTISPSLLLRQRPDRYAIRAGRNLPDKEFRYLRTVIVTAAIHQGLNSVLRRN